MVKNSDTVPFKWKKKICGKLQPQSVIGKHFVGEFYSHSNHVFKQGNQGLTTTQRLLGEKSWKRGLSNNKIGRQ
jgi:hypothetical protein